MQRLANKGFKHEPVVGIWVHADNGINFAGTKLVETVARTAASLAELRFGILSLPSNRT